MPSDKRSRLRMAFNLFGELIRHILSIRLILVPGKHFG